MGAAAVPLFIIDFKSTMKKILSLIFGGLLLVPTVTWIIDPDFGIPVNRAGLNHPVVDADGHVVEATPVILDFIKQVAGREMADRYIQFIQSFSRPNAPRKSFWLAPSGPNTIDRATAMLPRLFRARLDDAGIFQCSEF